MGRALKDMVVVITGASAGIGRALAEALGPLGARLVLAARRMDRLETLNESLGRAHFCVRTDVADPLQCRQLIQSAINHFGRLDTLICNAGYGLAQPLACTTHEQMLAIFQTNFLGTSDCIHAALPFMQQQPLRDGYRGQIMIVSSAMARRALPGFGAYAATKSAQLSFAEALRVELRLQKIAVTSVHPVGTETEFFEVAARERTEPVAIPTPRPLRQSAQTVAKAMIRGIVHPRPEIWPLRPARWSLGLATLCPGLTDRILRRSGNSDKHGL